MKIDEKYFSSDQGMKSYAIEDVLHPDETILWRSKPKKSAYILAAIFKMMPLAIIWLIFDGFFIGVISKTGEIPKNFIVFIAIFFVIHLAPVWIWLAGIVKAVAELKKIEYVFTEKRIIIRSGIIADYKFIHYDKISSVNAKVGLIDRLLHVGDIYIAAAGQKAVLYDQADPYVLTSKLQKIAMDILTDIQYPNALRPENNPGFNTKYSDSPFDDKYRK